MTREAARSIGQRLLLPLAAHRALEIDETGGVAAGPRQAPAETAADRICDLQENDGDGARP